MKTLAKTLHGSRLYGLENPKSDFDYKSIVLPSREDCFLFRAPRNVQSKEIINWVKVEYEGFALQEFLHLAARGEDVAITMLHTNDEAVLETSDVFQHLRANRSRFYTKKMAGMSGYCRGMAAKYALRADRMETVEKVYAFLSSIQATAPRLADVWDELPNLPHATKGTNQTDRGADKRIYEVAGKCLPATISPDYAMGIVKNLLDSYGERVREARNMGNADLKAISHSFRVGYQLKHLYEDGDFCFPLPENGFIRAVKEGKLNYVADKIDDTLNELISHVEELAVKSNYPEKVDRGWLDKIILDTYNFGS